MIIEFKTAKLAKKAGFDTSQFYCYDDEGKLHSNIGDYDWIKFGSNSEGSYVAPTQSELQKWLREKHDILVYVDPRRHHIFQYHIITHDNEIIGSERLNNWEKVLEKGLQKSLKLIK